MSLRIRLALPTMLILLVAACAGQSASVPAPGSTGASAPPSNSLAGAHEYAKEAKDAFSRLARDGERYENDPLAGFVYMIDWADTELARIQSRPAPSCVQSAADRYRVAVRAFRELVDQAREGLRNGDLLAAELIQRQMTGVVRELTGARDALVFAASRC